jgi:hypothetical protein
VRIVGRACVVAVAVSTVALLGGMARATTGGGRAGAVEPVVFVDPAGDSGRAADIKTVAVTNDDAGRYTFDIDFTAPLSGTSGVRIFVDSDQEPATGDPGHAGADYLISEDQASGLVDLLSWTGSEFSESKGDSLSVRLAGAPIGRSLIASVDRRELGGTGDFNFQVETIEGSGGAGQSDTAPDAATWNYRLRAPLRLKLGSASASIAKAGRPWTMRLRAIRSDTGRTLAKGSITCRATSGGTALARLGRGFLAGGGKASAFCRFRVPKTLRGRPLHGTITVTYQGVSVTKAFSTRIR